MRRLLHGLLLPLLLVLAQHGALLHALDHAAARGALTHQGDPAAPPAEDCGFCLAFAQVDVAVPSGVAPVPLLADLSYPAAVSAVVRHEVAEPSAPRNRGPPPLL
jgi:hypothetical protein